MTTTYLIDIEDFKRRADISPNLDTNRLKAQIGIAQEKYLIQLLCRELYDEIISQYPDSLSIENQALLPYIQDFLVYASYDRYLPNANLKSSASGFRVHLDTTSEVPTPEQMRDIIGQAKSDVAFYKDQLTNFLYKNENDYPLWRDSICNNCKKGNIPLGRFSKVGTKISEVRIKWT